MYKFDLTNVSHFSHVHKYDFYTMRNLNTKYIIIIYITMTSTQIAIVTYFKYNLHHIKNFTYLNEQIVHIDLIY